MLCPQNKRGGKVALQTILAPMTEFGGPGDGNKGDALYAMELALSLEKLNFQKLRALHDVADKHNDAQMCDFVESELLAEQVSVTPIVAGGSSGNCLSLLHCCCALLSLTRWRGWAAVTEVCRCPACQVEAVKEVATYVSQLRRVGQGHGVYHFDKTFRGA